MRERWFGNTGLRIPEIAVEGDDVELLGEGRVRLGDQEAFALVLPELADPPTLRQPYLDGIPILVHAETPDEVIAALERPEVSAALVPPERADLRELDLRRMKYG